MNLADSWACAASYLSLAIFTLLQRTLVVSIVTIGVLANITRTQAHAWQPMNLRRVLLIVFLLPALAACTGKIKLLEDGKVHQGSYDQLSKNIQVSIDGDVYRGEYVQGATAGFGTAFSGGTVVTGSVLSMDGSGQALLISSTGKVLRCVFGSVVAWRGQGVCQMNDGKRYDLLIGQ